MENKKLICDKCSLGFSKRYNLNRHLETVHPEKVGGISLFTNRRAFECEECHKKFNRRDNLTRHQQQCLPGQVLILFECDHCHRKFKRKSHLIYHFRTHYRSEKLCSKRIQCIECHSNFPSKRELNDHYRVDHQVPFLYENFYFECFEKFEEWKNKLEQEMICQFRKYSTSRSKTKLKIHYICHRSGIYKARDQERKRLMKLNGSKRIGGDCPADIIVLCNRIDHSCETTFQKVHVGHEVGTKSELKHTYLSREGKIKLVAKLNVEGQPEDTQSDIKGADVHCTNRKFKTNHALALGNDVLNVQSFIMQNTESILYFKDKWKIDEKYGLLENTDYMIVIMDTMQEENLLRYGHKIIAIDTTHGTNPQGYLLHTLLIVNVDFEGFPVAFALTNRNDCKGISVFLKCVKDKVGIIKTRTLMSDMQLSYIDCWNNIMQPPERHLYCMWHVHDQWKKNLQRISNVDKKKKVKKQLYSLATEMDITVFNEGLQSFLFNSDDDTKNFIEYFNTHYAICCDKWAYCYRPDAEMNANMYLERFHNILKKNVAKGKEIKTITSCLKYLLDSLKIKEKHYLCEDIRGEVSSKLRNLRCRHKTAEKELAIVNKISIQRTSYDTWSISSFSDSSLAQEIYTVKRREQGAVECGDSCPLVCIPCQTCFHQYKCTCQDSSVNNNMCKHIHALGIYSIGDSAAITSSPTTMHTGLEMVTLVEGDEEQRILIKEEEIDQAIEKAHKVLAEGLQYATNAAQVQEIISQCLEPIEPALKAANVYSLSFTDSIEHWRTFPSDD